MVDRIIKLVLQGRNEASSGLLKNILVLIAELRDRQREILRRRLNDLRIKNGGNKDFLKFLDDILGDL